MKLTRQQRARAKRAVIEELQAALQLIERHPLFGNWRTLVPAHDPVFPECMRLMMVAMRAVKKDKQGK